MIFQTRSSSLWKLKNRLGTEPYARWCGRTVNKIIIYLLPDYRWKFVFIRKNWQLPWERWLCIRKIGGTYGSYYDPVGNDIYFVLHSRCPLRRLPGVRVVDLAGGGLLLAAWGGCRIGCKIAGIPFFVPGAVVVILRVLYPGWSLECFFIWNIRSEPG